MATPTQVTIELSGDTLKLFDRYHKYTGTSPAAYITELVEKTLPTVEAMVDAMDEASADPDANLDVMELFGRRMAQMALQQREKEQGSPVNVVQ